MGRLNKKLQQKERKKLGGSAISKSAVLATLADRDKKKSETSILTIVKVLNSRCTSFKTILFCCDADATFDAIAS